MKSLLLIALFSVAQIHASAPAAFGRAAQIALRATYSGLDKKKQEIHSAAISATPTPSPTKLAKAYQAASNYPAAMTHEEMINIFGPL